MPDEGDKTSLFFRILKGSWAAVLIVGPVIGYIPQYKDIKRTRHYQGFSSVVSFILLTSNILRILSWFLKKYDIALVLQAAVMILAQLTMLHLIVRLKSRAILTPEVGSVPLAGPAKLGERSFWQLFWEWISFADYLLFLGLFALFFAAIILIHQHLITIPHIGDIFLYMSMLAESTLCMPQFYTNWLNKSTQGLSKHLVATWIVGDASKLGYFVISDSPLEFKICAIIQLIVDFGIIGQIILYRGNLSPALRPLSRAGSVVPLKDSTSSLAAETKDLHIGMDIELNDASPQRLSKQ